MATSSGTAKLTLPADDQIKVEREFAAPKHLIYKAVTTPELVKRWWNAKRGVVTISEIDLRVGGKWRSVMEAEGGFEVGFHGEYIEIVPNEKIVQTEAYEGIPNPDGNATTNTMTLEDLGDGRTKMTVLIQCPSAETRNAIVESGMEAGMQDAYDLLEEVAVSLG